MYYFIMENTFINILWVCNTSLFCFFPQCGLYKSKRALHNTTSEGPWGKEKGSWVKTLQPSVTKRLVYMYYSLFFKFKVLDSFVQWVSDFFSIKSSKMYSRFCSFCLFKFYFQTYHIQWGSITVIYWKPVVFWKK